MKNMPPFVRHDLPMIGKLLLPTIFLGFVGIHFSEFVYNAIMANKAINMAIILAASYGVVVILLRLISTQNDMSALDRFGREAKATGDMKKLLDMPWLKGRAIRHYLEHLAHTGGTLASQLDQDAIQNELNALFEEYNSKMELPQFLVGFMVAMGLLGTFIGLLETLTGISGMLDGMGHGGDIEQEFSKLVVELRKPLAGMGIAFSASMFGLVTSLQLSIQMIMLRRYTSRVMEKARSVMHSLLRRIQSETPEDMLALASAAVQTAVSVQSVREKEEDAAFLEAAQRGQFTPASGSVSASMPPEVQFDPILMNDQVSEAYFKTQDAIAAMANSIGLLIKRMDTIAKALEANIEVTQKTNTALGFGSQLTETNDRLVSEVRALAGTQEDGQKLMQKIISSLIQIDQSLMANNPKDLLSAHRESTATLAELFGTAQTQTRLFSEMLESQRQGTHEMMQSLRGVNEHLSKTEEIHTAASYSLSEIKDGLAKAVSSFALVDSVAENVSRQTLMLEASTAEDRASQKELVRSIQRELRDFTESVRQITGVVKG